MTYPTRPSAPPFCVYGLHILFGSNSAWQLNVGTRRAVRRCRCIRVGAGPAAGARHSAGGGPRGWLPRIGGGCWKI